MPRDPFLDMYLDDLARFPVLDRDGEVTLGRRVRRGDRTARQEMIQANLRLVVSVARQYEHLGLPLLDVIEEGNIGLMRAVERFDPEMECRFSTYAVHWIRQAIRRALAEKGRNVRVPTYMAELVARYRRHRRGNPANEDAAELVRALGLPAGSVKLVERIIATARQGQGPLDAGLLGEADECLAGNCSSPAAAESTLGGGEDAEVVRSRLARLSEREAEVVRYRYGIDGYPVLTLEEIGDIFSLTRERIRQIEGQALDRLRGMIDARAVL